MGLSLQLEWSCSVDRSRLAFIQILRNPVKYQQPRGISKSYVCRRFQILEILQTRKIPCLTCNGKRTRWDRNSISWDKRRDFLFHSRRWNILWQKTANDHLTLLKPLPFSPEIPIKPPSFLSPSKSTISDLGFETYFWLVDFEFLS